MQYINVMLYYIMHTTNEPLVYVIYTNNIGAIKRRYNCSSFNWWIHNTNTICFNMMP